ncbi:hypothetical protein NKDENANG_00131 [Candidatus Entotheonellaceae bacterium PAL068K]
MWRLVFLGFLILLGLCGCLTVLTRGRAATLSADSQYVQSKVETKEVPTPQLLGLDLNLSAP